ncbi:baseplate J/gp47 family protein [Bacillus sp. JJ1503]|uniref:baseplate J/gp47 family protein n=1 Tax=Bacillus sp. JJ1503 TaxID=3122956 RepID=UPI002FFF2D23
MAEPLNLDITYEDLMAQKLSGVDPSLDTREGTSLIYNATAANSIETVQMLATIQANNDRVFADTAPREDLIRIAVERGLKPFPATKAKWKGVFNMDVPISSRFSLDELNYVVIERTAQGEFTLECETYGNIGNLFSGPLIPIEYIDGLTNAELTVLLIPARDEEETEAFRERYFNSFESVAYGGNRADYKQKVGELDGVGGVRVYRAKYGASTVGLTIINSLFGKPTQTLIDAIQERVDPLGMQGEGIGIAPIDHIVTISGVDNTVIDIVLNITYQDGWTWRDIEVNVQSTVDAYFKELAEEWAKSIDYTGDHTGVVVRISQIETRLLGVPGVLDIANTLLNGAASNIQLDKESIPVRGVLVA